MTRKNTNMCVVELLDPRWKEQKAKAETRYATTNISHAEVANNLKRFASQRGDVFDPVTGQAISEEEQQRRKRAAIQSFDGNPDKTAGHVQTSMWRNRSATFTKSLQEESEGVTQPSPHGKGKITIPAVSETDTQSHYLYNLNYQVRWT
jgi:hypothetical protein